MANYMPPRRVQRCVGTENAFLKIPRPSQGFWSTFLCEPIRELFSMDFSEILEILQEDLADSYLYRKTWYAAEEIYCRRKSQMRYANKGMPELPKECYIAIVAYTMNLEIDHKILYQDFNKKSRKLDCGTCWERFPYKSLYALIARAIHGIRNNPDVTTTTYYRGLQNSVENLKEGDYIFANQFLSCSVRKEDARQFTSNQGTLLKFIGSPLAACGIADISIFPHEKELLLFPWNTFRVTSVKKNLVVMKIGCDFIKELPYSGNYIEYGIRVNNATYSAPKLMPCQTNVASPRFAHVLNLGQLPDPIWDPYTYRRFVCDFGSDINRYGYCSVCGRQALWGGCPMYNWLPSLLYR